ncbi:MAG: hypothetical protein RUMPE_00923 [Eubacteriales bacterium SKADARSKE-1]|nr:hypothetical protein [Eubacteriales bacterium SKADARSKE-1]
MKSKVLATVLATVSIFQGTLALGTTAQGVCKDGLCGSSFEQTKRPEVEKTPEVRKEEILMNYPPNLGTMQEFGLGLKIAGPNGELIEQTVKPDVHYRGEDGKEYFVFYNQNIEQLRNMFYNKLRKEIDEHWVVLGGQKNSLMRYAEEGKGSIFNFGDYIRGISLLGFTLPYWMFSNKETLHKSALLAEYSAKLKNALEECGSTIDNTDSPCSVIMSKDLSKNAVINPESFLAETEKNFYEVMSSKVLPYKTKVEKLNSMLDYYQKEMTPEASNANAVAFCFPLNRASYYLSNLEKDLQHKDLETLEAMNSLRKKIDRLFIEYRFIFEQNIAPILGVKVDRCKVIVEREDFTMMYLDRAETKKFIQTVKRTLDTKFANIAKTYSLEDVSSTDLIKLAETLQPESFQDMIDKMDEEIAQKNADSSKLFVDSIGIAGRAVAGYALNPSGLEITKAIKGDVQGPEKFSPEEIKECAEEEKRRTSTTKENKDSIKSTSAVCQRIDSAKLDPMKRSDIFRAFDKYLEYTVMQSNLIRTKNKRQFLDNVKSNQEEYVNLLKVFIELNRNNRANREDYDGTLISENRSKETSDGRDRLLREYFVREIQRLDGVL